MRSIFHRLSEKKDIIMKDIESFYKGKRVLITGHSGFKGSWLCEVLSSFGANVIGYSLDLEENILFRLLNLDAKVHSFWGDIRNLERLNDVFEKEKPEIVIHMAAQPIVRESYINPVNTFSTNIMGTVNVLECCRLNSSVKSVVNVTTDKVYRNDERENGYIETDILGGFDPYSNSKSCSELVTRSYTQSFLEELHIPVSTCRAGNVIGGGDFAKNRIIPDCVKAIESESDIIVRNPNSTRPYQHVLEPLIAYLIIAMKQYETPSIASNYNVGPNDESCITTGSLVTRFCEIWKKQTGSDIRWIDQHDDGPHETKTLKLDCTKINESLGWKPLWDIDITMSKLVEWYYEYLKGENVSRITVRQIHEYMKCVKEQYH